MTRLLLFLLLGLAAVPVRAQSVDLADPARAAEDRARDEHSKPIAVFEFIDVESGDVALDFHAGGGYNTWILSKWVGPSGVVFAESPARYADDLKARLASGDLAGAGNVVFVETIEALADDTLDLVLISRNYHDIEAAQVPEVLAHLDRALKPGGTLAIIDARAVEGRDLEAHRIADEVIVAEVTGAGFEQVDESELLANPADDHVGPKWDQREQLDQSLMTFRAPGDDENEPAPMESMMDEPEREPPSDARYAPDDGRY